MAFSKRMHIDSEFFKQRPGKRPPLRTFTEMAEEFGLSAKQLSAHMKNSTAEAPSAKIVSKNQLTHTNSYYDPQEMRAWWSLEKGKP